ncbi:BolA family transcriptional regulator [Flagellatimonas centrodinii]|uniref:BolA family protein n=1 Tax=Flagellatimonas centrodinii TaxID=2806210 RepID=UPI001FED9388|nr:BolA family protein [Flagellatimonas centrodinii]ULQ45913.1 BolA family transcriptional regulator [Flagellatimonas centrodinii]
MTTGDRIARIEAALRAALTPTHLEIRDDSHLHAGHAGARSGRGHFHVTLHSAQFRGMPPLARHRAVYAALGSLMDSDIHALSLALSTPQASDSDLAPDPTPL